MSCGPSGLGERRGEARWCARPLLRRLGVMYSVIHIRRALDENLFVIIPKPSASLGPPLLPTTTAGPTTTIAEPRPHVFAAHILSSTLEACEFAGLYHNRSIQTKLISKLQPEFLFARFAHALFPYLRDFLLESTCPRDLTVIEKNKRIEKWMSPLQYIKYQKDMGQSFCGEKRLRSAPCNQDEELNDEDNIYEERWKQRNASRERWLSEYGRDLCNMSEEDDWEDYNRGRSRHRDMWGTGVPGLSDPFSTLGPNEVNAETDLSEEEPVVKENDASTYLSGLANAIVEQPI
ncbi:hypothetical protein O1611_g5583 [Lasiodiplodia mahajangana]|uniref:Uncharacterized protein n=1 Tax=Lasiodiplodia mahajangana TaxID=1108764 RepID=A0ACC2JLA2_9PEZI|nr:hypothetical protein O1611_g5583 [Lasiodiplodia mahajangana]